MKIKVEELAAMKEELLRDFRMLNEQYFAEHPTYSPCLNYGENSDGYAIQAYIGAEDGEGWFSASAGIDDYLTDDDGNIRIDAQGKPLIWSREKTGGVKNAPRLQSPVGS